MNQRAETVSWKIQRKVVISCCYINVADTRNYPLLSAAESKNCLLLNAAEIRNFPLLNAAKKKTCPPVTELESLSYFAELCSWKL
jgi:hypothetical protein